MVKGELILKKALIIIDYVNDFVETDGKLTCGPPAQDIENNISQIIEEFSKSDDFIVVASDNHDENDIYNPEHNLFPTHCISGTPGCNLYKNVLSAVNKANPKKLIKIEKLRYSAFAGTNLDLKLRERNISHIYLVGVCSDICVLHTAVDAYNLGYHIYVYENGIASFNAKGHAFALQHFKNALGATIIM